jgi:dienelactone hydrolase
MKWHARSAAVALILGALALAGCSSGPQRTQVGPHFVTAPLVYLSTVLWPPPLSLVGLTPGSRIQLAAHVDAPGGRWESDATYTVPGTGIIDLNAVRPQLAPFGSPDSAGLIWSLQGPDLPPDADARLWTESTIGVHISALDDGRVVASTVLELAGLGSTMTPIDVLADELGGTAAHPSTAEDDSLAGVFYRPQGSFRPRGPAVILFDDDATGASQPYVAPLFALFGSGVFVVPVERAADQVHVTSTVTTSQLGAIIGWLERRPDVDSRHIFVYGTSQSEQLALWTAAHFAPRIYGVFGAGGATALLCRSPEGVSTIFDESGQVPCERNSDTVDDLGVVSLAGLAGPVVLGCTRSDEVLPNACDWQDSAMRQRGHHAGDADIRSDDAAHAITVPPGLPLELPPVPAAQATEQARVAFWNAVAQTILRTARS